MSLPDSIEVPVHLGGELLDFCLVLDDIELEVAAVDLLFGGLVGDEDDVVGDQRDLVALLAGKGEFELPVLNANGLD